MRFMKKFLAPGINQQNLISLKHDLDFPDSGGFVAQPLPVSFAAITQLSEERLPLVNSRPQAAEERWRLKGHPQPFVL